jgi:hypothetical protein
MKEGDWLYGTVGVLGFFGIVQVVHLLDWLLTPYTGHEIPMLISGPIIVWGGIGSVFLTIKAVKGGFGRFGDATRT